MNNISSFTLHELRCFDAVVRLGSFQAAAELLHRTHPSVFAAIGKLEDGLGMALLDRSGYRAVPTEAGRLFHDRAVASLRDIDNLRQYAEQLRRGSEPVLRVVLGDLCPPHLVLPILSSYFAGVEHTRLHLDYEAVGGPAERLRNDSADLVFHRAEPSDAGFEQIRICDIRLIAVAAPQFLPFDTVADFTPDRLRPYTQCVIRDTARETPSEDHFLIEGSPRCTVADHQMKRELILHGMAWGHLPDFMIEDDLRAGSLVRIAGRYLPQRTETLAAQRRQGRPHGKVATALWQHLAAIFADDPANGASGRAVSQRENR
jgi:DNA-binding transcriptional LysR family regulator